jgi:glucose-1-phosphate cytidylyltransferase
MKAVILAGGHGTRFPEETKNKPKPLVKIGNKPILWHIMKHFETYGVNEFIICLGKNGVMIKDYFLNYHNHNTDLHIDLKEKTVRPLSQSNEAWQISLIDTGLNTMTGGRLKRLAHLLGDDDFFFTYGDGVGNINLDALKKTHLEQKRLSTVTVVEPHGRFGAVKIDNQQVIGFSEKTPLSGTWINAGFFILSPKVLNFIEDDNTVWEQEPLSTLALNNQLSAYYHHDFWQPMDTLADHQLLQKLWRDNHAKWKTW